MVRNKTFSYLNARDVHVKENFKTNKRIHFVPLLSVERFSEWVYTLTRNLELCYKNFNMNGLECLIGTEVIKSTAINSWIMVGIGIFVLLFQIFYSEK